MAVDWQYYGKKAYQALSENGIAATLTFDNEDGTYSIATGITTNATAATEYSTHAILKNYGVDTKAIINPEDVEITFHSGSIPDTIPDLLNKEGIQLAIASKTYEVISIEAVRPAGVTMLYKARAKEYGS